MFVTGGFPCIKLFSHYSSSFLKIRAPNVFSPINLYERPRFNRQQKFMKTLDFFKFEFQIPFSVYCFLIFLSQAKTRFSVLHSNFIKTYLAVVQVG